jgi:hypothetical protein
VFGRPPSCRACHALLQNLQARTRMRPPGSCVRAVQRSARRAACGVHSAGVFRVVCALTSATRLRRCFRAPQGTLVPKLTAQMRREARRRAGGNTPAARRVDFGVYEGAPPPPRFPALAMPRMPCVSTPRGCWPAQRRAAPAHAQHSRVRAGRHAPLPPRVCVGAGLIADDVSRGCFFSTTYHDKARRRARTAPA